jgi:hypothetical protein
VRYVLLKHDKFNRLSPAPGRPGAGLELIERSSFADLYRVTARPIPLFEPVSGLGAREGARGATLRWALESPAVLALIAPCARCTGEFRCRLTSFNEVKRTVTIRQGRQVLARRTVRKSARLSFPLRFARRTELTFEFAPGPQRVADASPGATDPRALGIAIVEPRFVRSSP